MQWNKYPRGAAKWIFIPLCQPQVCLSSPSNICGASQPEALLLSTSISVGYSNSSCSSARSLFSAVLSCVRTVKQLVLHSRNQPTNTFAAGVVMTSASGAVHEKQRIDSAALHRISCSCVGSLTSVALFCCIFSFGTFFGIIRVYTVVFSDPEYHVRPGEFDSG